MATELIGAARKAPAPAPAHTAVDQQDPFGEITDYFSTPGMPPSSPMEIPMTSIEMAIPAGILDSLPDLNAPSARAGAPPQPAPTSAAERRSTDGLVKEVTVPLNLSLDELRHHRRIRLKITLDVNLLP